MKRKHLHLLRSGAFTDMNGATVSFSDGDLVAIADSYDPNTHEAPIVVGHPKTDSPAYGWVASLSTDAAGLHAEVHQVNPQFAEQVRDGAYKKLSAALYTPEHHNNPTPGAFYLKHVGFLGATPPVVKGLRVNRTSIHPR